MDDKSLLFYNYLVVNEKNLIDLKIRVKELVKRGYSTLGGIGVGVSYYYQAMEKRIYN